MRQQIRALATALFLLAHSALGQDAPAFDRWNKAMDDALVRFLPDASRFGMTVDPYPSFSGPANETYTYKGADSMVHRYPSYIVHQTWWYNDAELARQMAALQRDQASFKQESEATLNEFMKTHGEQMKTAQQTRLTEMKKLSKEGANLYQQGKTEQAQAVFARIEKLGPAVYPPYQALTESLNKRQNELADRERRLQNLRRQVSFQIHTNRTPSTTATAFIGMKPAGTLAGYPLYRQLRGNMNMGSWTDTMVDLAVLLAPPGYENPKVRIGHRELAVKCIAVWAWIQARPETIQADEAAARKVLESVNYNGLTKLIRH